MEETTVMEGVTEYAEGFDVGLIFRKGEIVNGVPYDRWAISSRAEGGFAETQVDLLELIDWLKNNRPELVAQHNSASMNINEIAARQFDWVERMGWHNKTTLEMLALICSEVGEAVNECRGDVPTAEFGYELADIIMRVADLAHWHGIDLSSVIAEKMVINEQRGTRGRRV